MADVFISYKRDQRERVQKIADHLRIDEELSVWFDANLGTGRGEGFDAEIEREVTSAYSVIACWTPAAIRSVYVRAESKKGLERGVLVPVLLEPCALPVPFNDIDYIDLTRWNGDRDDAGWRRVVIEVREKVNKGKRNEHARREHARASYERIEEKIYPGTLPLLCRRIAAVHGMDAAEYQHDIDALMDWIKSVAEKELQYLELGWKLANQQPGGDAWRFWGSGKAGARAEEITRMRASLAQVDRVLGESESFLKETAP